MARPVMLYNSRTGDTRPGYYGFSWTNFIWGGFPAVFRGDIVAGVLVVLLAIAAAAISFGAGWYIVGLWWGAVYNKTYTNGLLERGYDFIDRPEIVADARRYLYPD